MAIEMKRLNDAVIQLPGVRVQQTGLPINDAVVMATLYDRAGGILQQSLMVYVPLSKGVYEWLVDGQSLIYPSSSMYKLEVLGTRGDQTFRRVYDVTISD